MFLDSISIRLKIKCGPNTIMLAPIHSKIRITCSSKWIRPNERHSLRFVEGSHGGASAFASRGWTIPQLRWCWSPHRSPASAQTLLCGARRTHEQSEDRYQARDNLHDHRSKLWILHGHVSLSPEASESAEETTFTKLGSTQNHPTSLKYQR